ncbi:RAMP superfamily CRISPR-associated protein [Dethiothermospora halolimnae]|uniref:RAMP superfamily CRISPR-associated protein n=1 Tax=Dethiothermospora halolimnae TaxID=3114390 RepID=UPI003CCB8B35
MSKFVRYRFKLKAKSPLYFGSSEKGELLKDSYDKPFLMGNSIAGVIRSYFELEHKDIDIKKYLGGKTQEDFKESKLRITDGNIKISNNEEFKPEIKEGTKIDYDTGVACDGGKYQFNYIPIGEKLDFDIEIEDKYIENEIDDLVEKIACGIEKEYITFGGQINNGFGKLEIEKIMKKVYDLTNKKDFENFIKKRDSVEGEIFKYQLDSRHEENNIVNIVLEGSFPYGVYQSFEKKDEKDKAVTGLQKNKQGYYIPATSIRGLIRSNLARLFKQSDIKDEYLTVFMGGKTYKKQHRGKLKFEDVYINESKKIEINRMDSDETNPVYNKIDRLTGGVMNSACITHEEIKGKARINLQFVKKQEDDIDYKYFLYPIIIILRNIGLGFIPIGGATNKGLGEFRGEKLTIEDGIISQEHSIELKDGKASLNEEGRKYLVNLKNELKQFIEDGDNNG